MWWIIAGCIALALLFWLPDVCFFLGLVLQAMRERRRGRKRTPPGGQVVDP